jgi:tetratricopeptide (TPR) repeat protein
MKTWIYIVLFFSCSLLGASNTPNETIFKEANELYKQEKYQEAIARYEKILDSKEHSVDVYFNLGNAYYKVNKVAPAIYYYEKALLLSPNNKDVKTNLAFAQKMTIDDIKPVNKVGFNKSLETITASLHYNTWGTAVVGLSVLFLLLFIGYYFSGKSLYKRIFFIAMCIVPFLILIGFAAGISEKTRFNQDKPAIIFAETVALKSEPRDNAPEVVVLHEGTKVVLLESVDQWHKVQLANELEGWIPKKDIKSVK